MKTIENTNNMYPMVEAISLKKEIQSFCHKRLTPLVNHRVKVRYIDDRQPCIREITSTIVSIDAFGGIHFLSGKAVYPLYVETIEILDKKQM